MRPLFWSRVLLNCDSATDSESIWARLNEPTCDFDELCTLFSQKSTSSDEVRAVERKKSVASFSALDPKRLQAVGIIMGSCRVPLPTIATAVYTLDSQICRPETIFALYNQRGTVEELAAIEAHLSSASGIPLNNCDEFLLQLSKIQHFNLRVECWKFKQSFPESMIDVHESLTNMNDACKALKDCKHLNQILATILTLGNYLNGGTTRGQADGFGLDILPKIKDIKTQDGTSNLLVYVSSKYCSDSSKQSLHLEYPLPEAIVFRNASQVKLEEIEGSLAAIEREIANCERKCDIIISEADIEDRVMKFKDTMDSFLQHCKSSVEHERALLRSTQYSFETLAQYFCFRPKIPGTPLSSEEFFQIWGAFCDAFNEAWKIVLRDIAKRKFELLREQKELMKSSVKIKKVADGQQSRLKARLIGAKASATQHTGAATQHASTATNASLVAVSNVPLVSASSMLLAANTPSASNNMDTAEDKPASVESVGK